VPDEHESLKNTHPERAEGGGAIPQSNSSFWGKTSVRTGVKGGEDILKGGEDDRAISRPRKENKEAI